MAENARRLDQIEKVVSDDNRRIDDVASTLLSRMASHTHTDVPLSTVTAKGDLLVATASGAIVRHAVGSNDQVVVADSTQADGIKWASHWSPGDTSHVWTGSVVAGNGFSTVTNWSQSRSAGIATMTSSTTLTVNRAGKWSITLKCNSDSTAVGVEAFRLSWTGPWTDSELKDTRWRGAGFAGAGALAGVLSWTGYVSSGQASSGITAQGFWNDGAASFITHNMILHADYLGT